MRDSDKEFSNTVREFRTESQWLVGYDGQPVTAHKEVCHAANNRGGTAVFFSPSSALVAEDGFCIGQKGEQYDNY